MSCDRAQSQFDDSLDGRLPGGQSDELKRHLEDCASCRRDLEALEDLVAESRRLGAEVTPDSDLWPGIEARLGGPRRAFAGVLEFLRPAGATAWPQLVAAAAVVVVVTAAAIGWRSQAPPRQSTAAKPAPAEAQLSPGSAPASMPMLTTADVTQVRLDLLAAIDRQRDVLTPETLTVVEANTEIIQQAIDEILVALEADPSSHHLHRLLASQYQKEVELVNRISRL